MNVNTDSTLIAVRNEKGQLVGVMERLNKGFEVYVTKEANVKEVEMLFTQRKNEQEKLHDEAVEELETSPTE